MPDPAGVSSPTNLISLAVSEDEAGNPIINFEGMQDDIVETEL